MLAGTQRRNDTNNTVVLGPILIPATLTVSTTSNVNGSGTRPRLCGLDNTQTACVDLCRSLFLLLQK